MTPTAAIPRELDQFAVIITLHKDVDSSGGAQALVEFAMRYAFYGALAAIFLMVMALVVKLMWNCDHEDEITSGEARRATENSWLLMSKDGTVITYGTSGEDLERSSSTSLSEDLYDGKICVICYDDQRNCFFIPCGHCVTCHTCAYRIINEESKSCPICRGTIDKVRKLHIV